MGWSNPSVGGGIQGTQTEIRLLQRLLQHQQLQQPLLLLLLAASDC